MEKTSLKKILTVNSGLNVIVNEGIGFKDINLTFELSLFRKEVEDLTKAFQEASRDAKPEEVEKLLKKEYEIKLPVIKLDQLKQATKEIPLLAVDLLRDCITK